MQIPRASAGSGKHRAEKGQDQRLEAKRDEHRPRECLAHGKKRPCTQGYKKNPGFQSTFEVDRSEMVHRHPEGGPSSS